MAMWKRHLFVRGLGALAVVVLAAWLLRSWHSWGILTTVDPRILGLVGTTSMEPVELRMHNRRVDTRDGPRDRYGTPTIRTPIDKQIWFKLPAAYVWVVDLRDGPTGPQRLGFAFWHPSGDPDMPVEIKHQQLAAKETKPGGFSPAKLSVPSPFEDYQDQVEIRIEIGSFQHATDEQRQNVVTRGVFRELAKGRPCQREDIPSKGIVLFSPPPGVGRSSCAGNVSSEGFLLIRANDDQSAQYSVRCNSRGLVNCQLSGYFGTWGYRAWIKYADQRDWEGLHDAIQTFLKKYATRVD